MLRQEDRGNSIMQKSPSKLGDFQSPRKTFLSRGEIKPATPTAVVVLKTKKTDLSDRGTWE